MPAPGSHPSGRMLWRLLPATLILLSLVSWRSHYRLVLVNGHSMEPTLADGDLLLVDTGAYRQRPPDREDVVVARHGGEFLVKRVVGLPGETVEARDGRVLVNGQLKISEFARPPGPLALERGRLTAGRFALLGDNRKIPRREHTHAVVKCPDLVGKVVLGLRPFRVFNVPD